MLKQSKHRRRERDDGTFCSDIREVGLIVFTKWPPGLSNRIIVYLSLNLSEDFRSFMEYFGSIDSVSLIQSKAIDIKRRCPDAR